MSVFNEATISWGGEDYTFIPSMRFLQSVERNDISLVHVYHQALIGKPQTTLMAFILASILQHSGADVSEEQILFELNGSDPKAANDLYIEVMSLITPSREKKGSAPSE